MGIASESLQNQAEPRLISPWPFFGVFVATTWALDIGLHQSISDQRNSLAIVAAWFAMTAAMMTPTTVPMLNSLREILGNASHDTWWMFIAGYVFMWSSFALVGGGLQIASGADIRVVAPDARMAVMEMKWGLIPDMGGYALWRGMVREDMLRELTYTNREFSGAEALTLGFATFVDENPHTRAMAIAREIADRNPEAMREAKALFNEYTDMDEDAILMAESVRQARVIRQPNQIEAVMAGMQKRAGVFAD